MRALHPLGHPGGSARVEDTSEALSWVIQPWWRHAATFRLGQTQHIDRRQAAEAVLPAREDDHWLSVLQHVGDQVVRQGSVEEHHGATSLKDAEVGGHNLRVVLRHGHRYDLIRACEEGRNGRGNDFRPGIEFSECQGLSGVGNLQSREMRELLGRAAEDLIEPLDTLLMRYVDQVAVAKNIRQAVWAGVRLGGHLLRRPKVPPPRHKC